MPVMKSLSKNSIPSNHRLSLQPHTQLRRSSGNNLPLGGRWPRGEWGDRGAGLAPPQKGVTTYAMANNRQRPFAGAMRAAIFNTYRRSKAQVLYVVTPFAVAWLCMQWANERNEFLNSKEGRALMGGEE